MQKQKGMSLIGFLIVLGMVIFFAYLGMRIAPIYMEFYSVKSAMTTMAKTPGTKNKSPFLLKDDFKNRVWVNYSAGNVKNENIKVTRNNGVWLEVKYDVRKPIFGNLDVIVAFDEKVQLVN